MKYDDDATRDFVLTNKGYVKLAFSVEKAVPRIRNGAVEKILKRVENHLGQRFCSREWTVKFVSSGNNPQAVQIRKHTWQCGEPGWPGWQGVRLDRNWNGANITVGSFENVSPDEIKQICDKQNIGISRIRGAYVYCGLEYCGEEGNLRDWEGADFVFDAWHKSDKLAEELAKKMEELVKRIDDVLD